eukprot:c21632_g1_i1 orf=395-1237(+)
MSTGYSHLGTENVSGSVPVAAEVDHMVLSFPESNLQTFPPGETQGKISGSFLPPSDADDTFSKPGHRIQEEGELTGWQRFFSVSPYKPYFNVDTSDVLERIQDSFLAYRGNFVEKTGDSPDMYGPFWICTTLIFVSAALGNFAAYLAHMSRDEPWHYDINKVTWSAGMFYGYVAIVPLALYFFLKYLGITSGLVQLWCLYGYSLFIFIPASFISVVPIEIFRWVVAGVAGFVSASFLAINLRSHIRTQSDRWFLIAISSFLLQLGLALVLKLYFFTFIFN